MVATDSAQNVGRAPRVRVFLAGDVMTGRGIDQILPYPGQPELHEPWVRDARSYVTLAERKNGPISRPVQFDYVWGEALQVWSEWKPDLRIVNLETSVTISDAFWPAKGIHYRMHPDNVPCLAAAGVDCCVLANNHVMDWGYEGLTETLTTLHDAGLATAGAGANLDDAARPARLTVGNMGDVLVFAFADLSSGVPEAWRAGAGTGGVNLLPNLSAKSAEKAVRAIRRSAVRSPLLVIASIHWGGNWGYQILPEQRTFAQRLVDEAGVDIVHGHSSHHPIGMECYQGRTILYGCGDFLNDYEGIHGHEEFRAGLALMYFIDVSGDRGRAQQLEIVPMSVRQMRLLHAGAAESDWLAAKLDEVSRPFETRVDRTNVGLSVHPAR
jgi:poly-gamma-glutamate synthesis protein (capsule biosynthesis protein)